MSNFFFQASQTKPLANLSLTVGEEARPILWLGSISDESVHGAIFVQDNNLVLLEEAGSILGPLASYVLLSITGREIGTGAVRAVDIPRTAIEVDRTLGTLSLKVRDIEETTADMTYTGKFLYWHRSTPSAVSTSGPLLFAATSGMTGQQSAKLQAWADHGPLPEGLYSLVAAINPRQGSVDAANRRGQDAITNSEEGIEFLRIGGGGPVDPNWGTFRVHLSPISGNMFGRSGFYLHNSHKGFSHGCIEVGGSQEGVDFFDTLLAYTGEPKHKGRLTLRVKYSFPEQMTQGKTFRAP